MSKVKWDGTYIRAAALVTATARAKKEGITVGEWISKQVTSAAEQADRLQDARIRINLLTLEVNHLQMKASEAHVRQCELQAELNSWRSIAIYARDLLAIVTKREK
jgi:hypothetical protein